MIKKFDKSSVFHKVSVPVFILCVLLMALSSCILSFLLKTSSTSEYRMLIKKNHVGEIVNETVYVKSSVDVVDYEATLIKKQEEAKKILPVFSYSLSDTFSMINNFDILSSAYFSGDDSTIEKIVGEKTTEKLKNLSDPKCLSIVHEMLIEIYNKGLYSWDEIHDIQLEGYNSFSLSNNNSVSSNYLDSDESIKFIDSSLLTTENVLSFIISYFDDFSISIHDVNIIKDIITNFLQPNVKYNDLLSNARKEEAYQNAENVILHFEKGDVLLKKNHVFTQDQLNKLQILSNTVEVSVYEFIVLLTFLLFSFSVLTYSFVFFTNGSKSRITTYIVFLTIFFIFSSLFTFFGISVFNNFFDIKFFESFLPVFFLPVIMTMITNQKYCGIISSFINGVGMIYIPGASVSTFFYIITCGLAFVYLVRFMNRRIDILLQWFYSVIIVSITDVFYAVFKNNFSEIKSNIMLSSINISLYILLIIIILPLIEYFFNLPTKLHLSELAFTESLLLSQLSQVAPGTFSHSKNVAELASSAAKCIKADAMIAYVGGLYHDIGKIEHPEYFIENQTGDNKHNNLNPTLSVSIIKNHVKTGAQKGKEFKLPSEIIDIIANHHGNDVIKFFYNEAKELNEDVNLEDFRYQAEIPSSKECAIVMIADTIEAAARTVGSPSVAKFSKLITQLVNGKIERRQLDNSQLTMNEIQKICEDILKNLTAQYHSRIQYPEENEKK